MASPHESSNGQDPVSRLAAFLRDNKSDVKILTGTSKLSLTTVYLSVLNRCFATTHPSDSCDENEESELRHDAKTVTYLRDILHRTVALKLMHENVTLQGAVDVSRFHALTVLEVKRVPIHLLTGLSSLRYQLRVLVCSRCVHSLQMLLVGCGGDKAEEQDWPILHTLNLSYNYIDALDESLRFLPALKALDLSHNNIRHTRDYFESLPEIIHLNLSFNQLARVPPLGEFIPSNLQTLHLRGNHIESLSGIEYLEELETLDLAKNAIFDSTELFSLGYLHRLRKMHFHGNPFTFQGKWRMFVAKYLAPEASQVVTLIDDIPLSKSELRVVPQKSMTRPQRTGYLSDNFSASCRSTDISYDNWDETVDADQNLKKRKAKVKRSTARVRNASISDQAEARKERLQAASENSKSPVAMTVTPGTDAKKEFEDMRQMHGKDWLLALQNPYEQVTGTIKRQNTAPHLNDTNEATTSNSDAIDVKHTTNGSIVQADVHSVPNGGAPDPAPVVEEVVSQSNAPVVDGAVPPRVGAGEEASQDRPPLQTRSSEQFDLLMRQDSELQTRMMDGDLNDEHPEEEEEDLCGPLLIRLLDTDPPVQLFVTVKESFIEEKNVYGKVVQRLETRSLIGLTMTIVSIRDEFNNAQVDRPVIKLSFDYINRDRRKREYVMEDMNSCAALMEVLEPIMVLNKENRMSSMVYLQCLNCNLEFPKDQAKRKVEKKSRKTNAWGVSEESGSDIDSVNEVLTCPNCDRNILVEIDDPTRSEANTPYGSVGSIDFLTRPIASSSPWKEKEKVITMIAPASQPLHMEDDYFHRSTEYSETNGASVTADSLLTPSGDETKTNKDAAANGLSSSGSRSAKGSPTKECSLTTSSSSSQLSALSSDFKLPDPTIKMEATIGTPVDELSNYPPEKLKELLTTNKSGFKQSVSVSTDQPNSAPMRYSLCPADGGSVSSYIDSGPTTPVQNLSTNPFDLLKTSPSQKRKVRKSASDQDKPLASKESSIYDHNSGTRMNEEDRVNSNPRLDHRYSEDDIVVLDSAEITPQHSSDFVGGYRLPDGERSDKDAASLDAISYTRLDSNESDIAVISETDLHSSSSAVTLQRNSSADNLSVNSDNVFESGHTSGTLSSTQSAADKQTTNDHREYLSSNEQTIYKSDSGTESASGVNGSGHFDASNGVSSTADEGCAMSVSHSLNSDTQSSRQGRSEELSMLEMAAQDCCKIHHRLKLFLSMSVFGDEEELTCLLKGNVCQFSKKQTFDGLVVVATENLYILKITKEESEEPSDWLVKKTQHPLKDLVRFHVGLGNQSVQIESSSDGILYTVVTGDKKRSRQFVTFAMESLSRGPWGKKFKGVQYEHPQTYLNLTSEVFVPMATGDTSYEVDAAVSVFVSAQLKTFPQSKQGVSVKLEPVGVLVTATDVYLVEVNNFYPLAAPKSRKSVKGQQQFTPKGHRKISDISGLELYTDSSTDVTISFFSEDTGEESQWNLSTLCVESLDQFLASIKLPWREMFGVDLQETTHPSIIIQDLQ